VLKNKIIVALLFVGCLNADEHDILLEAKGAYFLASNDTFKNIYGNGGGIYGAEITGKVCDSWYLFASADFFSKNGCTCIFNTPTNVSIANIGLGIKYLVPFCYGDFYVGLGVLPTHLRTFDDSPNVPFKDSKWGCGGIAKTGFFINLPCNFLLDIFFDYSFVKISCPDSCPTPFTQPRKANVSGFWFGAGLGYRFN